MLRWRLLALVVRAMATLKVGRAILGNVLLLSRCCSFFWAPLCHSTARSLSPAPHAHHARECTLARICGAVGAPETMAPGVPSWTRWPPSLLPLTARPLHKALTFTRKGRLLLAALCLRPFVLHMLHRRRRRRRRSRWLRWP